MHNNNLYHCDVCNYLQNLQHTSIIFYYIIKRSYLCIAIQRAYTNYQISIIMTITLLY